MYGGTYKWLQWISLLKYTIINYIQQNTPLAVSCIDLFALSTRAAQKDTSWSMKPDFKGKQKHTSKRGQRRYIWGISASRHLPRQSYTADLCPKIPNT